MSLDYVFAKPQPKPKAEDMPMSSPMLYRSDASGVLSPRDKKISLDEEDDGQVKYLGETDEIPIEMDIPEPEQPMSTSTVFEYEKKGEPDEIKEDRKEEKKFDFQCSRCASEIKEKDRACAKCGQYIPQPGETFDISERNFQLPSVLGILRPPTEQAMNEHEMPFPSNVSAKDLPTHKGANEWIFNHLPLTEEQKETFLEGEILAQLGPEGAKLLATKRREKKGLELKQRERERISSSHLVALKDKYRGQRSFFQKK